MSKANWAYRCVIVALGCMLTAANVYGYAAVQNKADHTELRIVPALGKVTIDGDLKDWDLSGPILMFIDKASKETHQLRGAMMYDKEYLYVCGRLKDPTPMRNQYHFGGQVNMAWSGGWAATGILTFFANSAGWAAVPL